MSEQTGGVPTPDEQGKPEFVLLMLIVANPSSFDDIVTALLDIGVSATIVQSKGLMAFLREEMPIFSGLASMMPEVTGSRILISATKRELADRVMKMLTDEFSESERPIGFSIGLDNVVGLRR
ncbi:MAG: hypothetical protein RLN60_05125 [Phycisphaerales bacterium]